MNHDDVVVYYETYAPMILRRCRYILRDEDLAFDAMQDVFVKILSNRPIVNVKNISAFLYKMATNHCLNIISRKDLYLKKLKEMDFNEKIEFENELLDKISIESLFNGVPKKTRTIAILKYKHKLTLNEIADVMGYSVSGIRKRLMKFTEQAARYNEKEQIHV